MHRSGAIAALWFAASCYRPAAATSCAVLCGPGGECPSGLACFDGLCRASSSDTCNGVPVDAVHPADSPDGPSANGDACVTFGSGLFAYKYCNAKLPAPLTLAGTFDTNTQCVGLNFDHVAAAGGDVCVAIASQITVPSALTAIGAYPLVLVSDDIDVMASITSLAGTGFGCMTAPSGVQGAGGAGGTAGTQGGDGGAGDGTQTGAALPNGLTTIRGGCAGGYGSNVLGSSGDGGIGGGVLYLIGTQITLRDGVHLFAPGLGGQGGAGNGSGGAGGGGAGGLIAIDSEGIQVGASVVLCADGGGGGGGGAKAATGDLAGGGADACALFPTAAGGGQGASSGGGTGGDGAVGATVGMNGAAENMTAAGGGGGGGGVGWIRAFGTTALMALGVASVDPPAQ